MSNITKISIIGAGVVGKTFAKLLADCPQYQMTLGSRSQGNRQSAVKDADVVLLTVSDSAIQTVCTELANSFHPNAVVVHCSGALTSEVLRSHQGPVASMHPLQTFPNVAAALPKVQGTYAYCEGDEAALPVINRLAQALGMQAVAIAAKDKPLYHAAAVMACNNLVALMESALKLAEAASIDRDTMWKSLKPLIDATVENIDRHGTQDSLTGPVARADVKTISAHVEAMRSNPAVDDVQRRVYRALGLQAAQLVNQEHAELLETLTNKPRS